MRFFSVTKFDFSYSLSIIESGWVRHVQYYDNYVLCEGNCIKLAPDTPKSALAHFSIRLVKKQEVVDLTGVYFSDRIMDDLYAIPLPQEKAA